MASGLNTQEGRGHFVHIHNPHRLLTHSPAHNHTSSYFMNSPYKAKTPGTLWFLLPALQGTNLPFHTQNTVKCDECIKHGQHVTLIYDHMQVVPIVGWEKKIDLVSICNFKDYYILFCACVCACVHEVHGWRAENNFLESVLSSHHVDPVD